MAKKTIKIPKLVKELSDADASKRRNAAELLSSGDERAIYPLIKSLGDTSPGVQDTAMRSIISIGGEVAAYMMMPLLRGDAYLRNTAIIVLRELGRVSVPLLYRLLKDRDENIRKFGLDLLIDIKEGVLSEIVLPLLRDTNQNVRASAVKLIGLIMNKEAVPYIIDVLRDEEWVCFSALEALSLIKDESSLDAIVTLLDSPYDAIRYAAIETLGNIGSSRSINPLLRHLSKSDGMEKTVTIKNIVKIGIPPSISISNTSDVFDMLIDLLKNGDWDEKMIALKGIIGLKEYKAIASIVDIAGSLDPSDPESEDRLTQIKEALLSLGGNDTLIDVLNNPSIKYRGRKIAIEIIGVLKCRNAVPSLIKQILEGNSRDVRRAAVKALGEINGDEATQVLVASIDDKDSHVREAAITALGKIGDKSSFGYLLQLLKTEKYGDVTEKTVESLLMIDSEALYLHLDEFDSQVREYIGRFAKDKKVLLLLSRDKDATVRGAAIAGLGKINDDMVIERLIEALHDSESLVRKSAVMAMGELNCCFDILKTALKDEDMWVRLYTVKALGHCLNEDEIGILIPMLEDTGIPVILSAIDAIKQIGGREAFAVIDSLQTHENPVIREKGAEAIESK